MRFPWQGFRRLALLLSEWIAGNETNTRLIGNNDTERARSGGPT